MDMTLFEWCGVVVQGLLVTLFIAISLQALLSGHAMFWVRCVRAMKLTILIISTLFLSEVVWKGLTPLAGLMFVSLPFFVFVTLVAIRLPSSNPHSL